jgi:predicted dinucleotide-binding enzyme
MRYGVLGTGIVGQTLATKLVQLGHEVKMGSRQARNDKALAWVASAGERASEGSFADAAAFGEAVINVTAGVASLDALTAAGAENLAGKLLIDAANPLDFSKGMPPTLSVCNDDSLGEQIQRSFPDARVVKAFNAVNVTYMVEPAVLPERHTLFICGNDAGAKAQVRELAMSFGWRAEDVLDLGDISAARGTETYLLLWLRLVAVVDTWRVSVKVVVG